MDGGELGREESEGTTDGRVDTLGFSVGLADTVGALVSPNAEGRWLGSGEGISDGVALGATLGERELDG